MLTRVNPLGWVLGDKLEPTQINGIDVQLARAIDGVDGGAYSLANPLVIDGFVSMDGTVALNGNVGGQWSPSQPIIIDTAGLRISDATLQVTQAGTLDVTDGSTLAVTGSSVLRIGLGGSGELSNGATFRAKAGTGFILDNAATITVGDGAQIDVESGGKVVLAYGSSIEGFDALVDVGRVTVREDLRLRGTLYKDTASAHILDRIDGLSATTQTLTSLSADTYIINTAGMTGDITITVPDGEHDGQVIRFVQGRKLTSYKVHFALSTPSAFQSAGNAFNIELLWNGNAWIPVSWSDVLWP